MGTKDRNPGHTHTHTYAVTCKTITYSKCNDNDLKHTDIAVKAYLCFFDANIWSQILFVLPVSWWRGLPYFSIKNNFTWVYGNVIVQLCHKGELKLGMVGCWPTIPWQQMRKSLQTELSNPNAILKIENLCMCILRYIEKDSKQTDQSVTTRKLFCKGLCEITQLFCIFIDRKQSNHVD